MALSLRPTFAGCLHSPFCLFLGLACLLVIAGDTGIRPDMLRQVLSHLSTSLVTATILPGHLYL